MISGWIVDLSSVPLNTLMRFVESSAHRVLNMHHQASPVSRTPSMPAVDTGYIPPVPPLIQDYRPYYPTPNDLSGKEESCLTLLPACVPVSKTFAGCYCRTFTACL